MNINLAINEGSKILKNKFIPNPLLDAEILMGKIINKDRNYILLNYSNPINKNDLKNFYRLIEQRSLGNPVAYLTKKKSFWNSEFIISNDTLIPRPDTELVVENALKLTKQRNKLNILDIGVGSGCILLSILKERKDFFGTGIDISEKCLNISKKNAINLKISSRAKLYKSDVDKFNSNKYDLIVSNPPYIKKLDLFRLEDDVRLYEPKMALDGGFDGFAEINKVIMSSSMLLKPNGSLIIEIDERQKKYVTKNLIKNGFFIYKICDDLSGKISTIISKRKLK